MCLEGPGHCGCTEPSDSLGDQENYSSSGESIWQICKEINLEISLARVSYPFGGDPNTVYSR